MKKTTVKAHHAKGATHAKAAAKPPSAAELQKEIKSLQSEVEHIKHPATAKSKHKATTGTKHKATVKHGSKKRTLTPGDVGCCAAEALAMSLRLQGVRVSDEDVLALYWHTAGDPDAGASVLETMEAAWRYGLGGVRPAWRVADPGEVACAGLAIPDHRSLILGVELPGPHTLLAADGGLWSWGEPFDPAGWPDAVVEEAWAVSWS